MKGGKKLRVNSRAHLLAIAENWEQRAQSGFLPVLCLADSITCYFFSTCPLRAWPIGSRRTWRS